MNTTINVEETIQTINKQNKRIEELCLEIERLNNIINELEKYLETEKDNYSNSWHYREWIRQVFNKLKELKEDK